MNPIERKHIKLLLNPSALSGTVSVCVSLLLIIGATIISLGKTGSLKDDLFTADYFRQGLNGRTHTIAQNLANNHFINQLPLLLFWAAVGVIAYLFVAGLFSAISDAVSIEESLNYVHARPHQIIIEVFWHLILRLVCLAIGLGVLHYFFKSLLPYCLAVVSEATAHWTLLGGLKLAGVTILLIIIGHVLTIIMRLIMLRPRIFGYQI